MRAVRGLKGKRASAKGKVCPRCRRDKPECEFTGGKSWCKVCCKIDQADRRKTGAYRAWRAEYRSRPEVIERERTASAARMAHPEKGERWRAWFREYNRSPRGRTVKSLSGWRLRLARATDPEKIETARENVAFYEAELARIERDRDAELHDDEEAA